MVRAQDQKKCQCGADATHFTWKSVVIGLSTDKDQTPLARLEPDYKCQGCFVKEVV